MNGARRRAPEAEYSRTASDYRKTKPPKGLVPDRYREAYRLKRFEGLTNAQLAVRFGVAEGTIAKWCEEARSELAGR